MKNFSKFLTIAALAVGFSTCASADIVWTLSGVDFLGGETATGSFTTNNAANTIESYNIVLSGGISLADFTAMDADGFFLPSSVGFGAPPLSNLSLFFAGNLTSAGGTVHIASGSDDGLSLLTGKGYNPEVIGVDPPSVPEPSTIPVLAGGALLLGFSLRRKLIRAS